MTDLPKLPGGWVWRHVDQFRGDIWHAAATMHDEGGGGVWVDGDTRAEAIARVVAMVEAVVGSEVKRG